MKRKRRLNSSRFDLQCPKHQVDHWHNLLKARLVIPLTGYFSLAWYQELWIYPRCVDFLASHSVRRILKNSDLSIPTSIIPLKRTFATHLRLAHFSENFFNVTAIWSNAEVQQKEGFENGGDALYGMDDHYEVEWVHGEEEGLALKDGF